MRHVISHLLRLSCLATVLLKGSAWAQTPTPPPGPNGPPPPDVPAFNTIRTPTSPAFTLLGVEPSAVERPNTPAGLAVSLLNAAGDLNSAPKDFALEVSPYWLVGHPRLTWENDARRSPAKSLLRTLSLSMATAEIGTEAAPVTGLSVGGRASLFSGKLTEDTKRALVDLQKSLGAESALALRMMATRLTALGVLLKTGKIDAAEHDRRMQDILDNTIHSDEYRQDPVVKAVEKQMENLAVNREGFVLELAGAASWSFANAVWTDRQFDRWGVWLTPSFQSARVSTVGVIRYQSKDSELDSHALDLGVRATRSADRYAFSVEYVNRSFPDSDNATRHRLIGIAEYRVAPQTWLCATFGRDHSNLHQGSLVARLGVSFNFSQDRYDFMPK